MRITLTTERGEQVSFDLHLGENAFLSVEGADLPPGASLRLHLHPSRDSLGLGAVDEDQSSWWD